MTGSSDEPFVSQKGLFDIPDGVTYLNCAYMAPQLRSVTVAGERAAARKARPWLIEPEDFFSGVERLRSTFANLIGGDADGVAVLPSVAYGISLAAAQLEPSPGDEILVLEDQFPSNVYPWRELASRTGANVRTIPRSPGIDWTDCLLAALGKKTAVVAVPGCHWTDGSKVDLARLEPAVREVGAALVVDGTQSVGAVPFEVSSIQPDFLVVAAYKWLLGPYSMAFAWVHPRHREGRPIEYGWSVRAGAEDFAGLVDYTDHFRPGARRYDVGETANFALVPMAQAALDQILTWGVGRIAATCSILTDAIAQAAEELGLEVPAPEARSPHLIGLRLPPGADASDVAAQLKAESVYVSVRGTSIRVSPHLYNDLDDVSRLAKILAASLSA